MAKRDDKLMAMIAEERKAGFAAIERLQAQITGLKKKNDDLADALKDCVSGLNYIKSVHGELYGVGWDRMFDKAKQALEVK